MTEPVRDLSAREVPSGVGLLRYLFGLSAPVRRRPYAIAGFSLMLLKYMVEAGLIRAFTGRSYTLLDFVNPVLSMREEFFRPPAPEWLQVFFFLWTLPFLWIAVSMSFRRGLNAGGGLVGLLVLLPLINLVVMLLLCVQPERNPTWSPPGKSSAPRSSPPPDMVRSALVGIAVSVLLAVVLVAVIVHGMGDYGASLFLGSPVLVGAVSSYLFNRRVPRTVGESLLVAELAILLSGCAMLLFAFEGLICLVMLLPIAAVMGLLGGLIGWVFAAVAPRRGPALGLLALGLPLVSGAESAYHRTPEYEVRSHVIIDAPPEVVWPHVIGFSELPPPPQWYFQLGVAYPVKATIEGRGVGAVRRCEFSTGAFVEPITVWDEPSRLAFSVRSQPPPMHELSPYRHVHPPHLDGYLRCQRGEFRLIPLPGGRTRLEGSTWYEFELYPQDYWTMWSDLSIHRIHLRVLNHIRDLAETDTE